MEERLAESKYAQQHLANERTYLAWVRTSIAIIGLGFVAAGIVFQNDALGSQGRLIASIGGIGAVLMGSCVIFIATRDYFLKRRRINEEHFTSPRLLIWFVCLSLGLISLLLVMLVLLMLFWS